MIGFSVIAQTARAERVLSETTFDERGVVGKTYDELNPPDNLIEDQASEQVAKAENDSVAEDPSEPESDNGVQPSASGLVQFFSNLFSSDDNSQEPSATADDQLDAAAAVAEEV